MPKIVVGQPSLYPKLEVEINGRIYIVRPLNQAMWDSLAKLEAEEKDTTWRSNPAFRDFLNQCQKADIVIPDDLISKKSRTLAESMSVLYEQIVTMTGASKKIVDALDIRDIQRIINFVTDAVRKGPEDEEKKELRPEEKN